LTPSFTYDRMADDVRTLTGQGPLSVQDFRQQECGDNHRAGKSGLSVCGCLDFIGSEHACS
jgi:hypothetical protein